MVRNPVEEGIERDRGARRAEREVGPVARIARNYDASSDGEPGRRLLGFLLSLDYDELSIVTCDPWKRACGGVPRNSFVMIKLSEAAVGEEDRQFLDRVILARVTDSVPTPVERDIQGAVFQLHKVQAIPDPVTAKELQWSALKASVVGTYYDARGGDGKLVAAFGNDVDTFFAPHAYAVFVPSPEDLDSLVNSFVSGADPLEIGRLRYTETPRPGTAEDEVVPVRVDPRDFVGHEYGNRTALFGKTRMGKSNTIKVVADTVLSSDLAVGQVIFDPSGEYTYVNPQDRTSLYAMHPDSACATASLLGTSPPNGSAASSDRRASRSTSTDPPPWATPWYGSCGTRRTPASRTTCSPSSTGSRPTSPRSPTARQTPADTLTSGARCRCGSPS
jgi:hypothetical protein